MSTAAARTTSSTRGAQARATGPNRPTNRTSNRAPAGQNGQRPSRITEEDKQATRSGEALHRALAITRRIGDGTILCPGCNEWAVVEKKFKMHADGGYKHFGSAGCHGDAISVLRAAPLELDFVDAVCLLVGKPTRAKVDLPDGDLPPLTVSTFRAKVDTEVFNGILKYGQKAFDGAGIKAAKEFYAQWHIDPDVVEASGAVYITDPRHFAEQILERFGRDRLIACGLFKENDKGEAYCLVSKKWPVIEPHRHPATGDVINIQFRASNEQYARYLRHKAGELEYDGNQKFINLRGIPSKAIIGCGLEQVDKLPPGSTVYIVEGFKDRLASETSGAPAYGIPGVDFRPDPKICQLLARHHVVVALDGDRAGLIGMFGGLELDDGTGKPVLDDKGKKLRVADYPDDIPPGAKVLRKVSTGLIEHLQNNGVTSLAYYLLTGGMDITDRLIARHAAQGCTCTACTQMRAKQAS